MVYLDTSALAKWYLNEPRAEELAHWIQEEDEVWISTLTKVEMRCLLARKRRSGQVSIEIEQRAFATFQEDVARAFLFLQPVEDKTLLAAVHLNDRLREHPLRSLDAIHLSIARDLQVERLATADAVMADAAKALDLEVTWFGPPPRRGSAD
jgi:predicted nucleic acid-binding protein